MKSLLSLVSVLFLALSCGTSRPLRNLDNNNIIPAGLSKRTIMENIVRAGAQRQWVITPKEGAKDTLVGKLQVRKHYVEVQIPYTQESYKILYVRSENLNYNPVKGTIHRSYNRWLMNLKADIDSALAVAVAIK